MTGCPGRIYLGNFVVVGADGGCSQSSALVDFAKLCTYKVHIEVQFLRIKRFLDVCHPHTISAFHGRAGLLEKRR
jgi:hypothetical protein